MISQLNLRDSEIRHISDLLKDVSNQFSSPEDPAFLHDAPVISHELPLRARKFINAFRLHETDEAAACIISGYPIDDNKIGKTPDYRSEKADTHRTLNEQMMLVLFASLLGEPVGWSTQQAGHIVHDIFPVRGQENDQTGSSSKTELMFHTEDAFHPYRGDYLGMMCLRNKRQVATSLAPNRVISTLSPRQLQRLFEPCVVIRPDASQFEKHDFLEMAGLSKAVIDNFIGHSEDKMNKMNLEPEPVSVLFGDPSSPYIRIDCSVYMDPLDEAARDAIAALRTAFEKDQADLIMKAGEICFIDNLRAVHGRKPFKACYNGTDRWLKRVNVTRDIRKSRDMRITGASRIIF